MMGEEVVDIMPEDKQESSSQEQQPGNPGKPADSSMSREEFLKFSGLALLLANGLGRTVGAAIKLAKYSRDLEEFGRLGRELIPQIKGWREKFGLSGYPVKIEQEFSKPDMGHVPPEAWDKQLEIVNTLPKEWESYGEVFIQTMGVVAGKNAAQLIKEVTLDEYDPNAIRFNVIERYATFPEYIQQWHGIDFINIALHEGTHGLDPDDALSIPIPTNMLIQMEYGKWLALSQAFEVPGEFFNHPSDGTLPNVKTALGQNLGELFLSTGDAESVFALGSDPDSKRFLRAILVETGRNQGVPPEQIKLTEEVCLELGGFLVEGVLAGKIKLNDPFRLMYEQHLENALNEIFAEMVKKSIMEPSSVNDTVIEGISIFLTALREEKEPVDLRKIHAGLMNLPIW